MLRPAIPPSSSRFGLKVWFLPLFVLNFLIGCGPTTHYKVELRPKGDALERILTIWQAVDRPEKAAEDAEVAKEAPKPAKLQKDFLSKETRIRLQKLYDHHEYDRPNNKHTFRGQVREKTPADLGGDGTFIRRVNPMGSASMYVERIRGEDDRAMVIEKRLAASDKLAGHLTGWLHSEFVGEPGWKAFRTFLQNDFRRDLKNLILYLWSGDASGQFIFEIEDERAEAAMFRSLQYLAEREYFAFHELPALLRGVNGGFDDDPEALSQFIQSRLSKKLGVDLKPLARRFREFFDDEQKVEASLDAYFRPTPEYERALEAWREESKENPELSKPEPNEVLDELVDELLHFELFSSNSPIEVHLILPAEPALTNGAWDDGKLTWSGSPESGTATDVPLFCYAIWARPDAEYQRTRFGKVILDGEELLEYAVWYEALNEKETGKWDALMAGLKPGDTLTAKIKAFRFTPVPADVEPEKRDTTPDHSDQGRNLLLNQLEGE